MTTQNKLSYEIDKTIRRLGRLYFKIRMAITGNKRPTSSPYISGDSFRALADHIHDETGTFNPESVNSGDIIFVSQGFVYKYLQTLHKEITQPYILICHNGDETIDHKIVSLIDEKIIHFFAQDLVCEHDRITPIPIGLENLHFYINGITNVFTKIRSQIEIKTPVRKNKIFYNFSISTNPEERGPAKEYFSNHPLMEKTEHFLAPRRHLEVLLKYKFVASPPGHAIESCRTWEAMYIKTVPIVKDYVAMKYFAKIGLPIWVVADWKELEGQTEESLETKYNDIIMGANFTPLFLDFWMNKIYQIQKDFKSTLK